MLFVIAYDIQNNRIRTRIADALEGYGRRVQYSVFECQLTRTQYAELQQKLATLLQGRGASQTDSIRSYRLCGACEEKVSVSGSRKRKAKSGCVLV